MASGATKARVVRFYQTGGPEVLKLEEVELPPPAAGEVQIEIKALGLNRAEVMFRNGTYLEAPKFPARPGYEAAGTVAAIGPNVGGFKVGDTVSVVPAFSLNQYGTYGDRANMPAAAVVHHPPNLSWQDAAAIWMQYITAYGAIIDIAKLASGDTILIPAASSSVGLAAIQLANLVGATPIALTRTGAKRQALLDAGAKAVVATEEQDLTAEVMKLTGGQGARVVFDPVGGRTATKLQAAMSDHGIMFLYGVLSPEPTEISMLDTIGKGLTVRGYMLIEVTTNPDRLAKAVKYIVDGLAVGKLKPVIARTFKLDQIVDAHRYLESNEQFGKIVVTT